MKARPAVEWGLCHFPHVSGWLFPINVSKCIDVYRSVSYVYRDFRFTPLDTVSRHFLFDTRSIQARYVLGAVRTSILYRFPQPSSRRNLIGTWLMTPLSLFGPSSLLRSLNPSLKPLSLYLQFSIPFRYTLDTSRILYRNR